MNIIAPRHYTYMLLYDITGWSYLSPICHAVITFTLCHGFSAFTFACYWLFSAIIVTPLIYYYLLFHTRNNIINTIVNIVINFHTLRYYLQHAHVIAWLLLLVFHMLLFFAATHCYYRHLPAHCRHITYCHTPISHITLLYFYCAMPPLPLPLL